MNNRSLKIIILILLLILPLLLIILMRQFFQVNYLLSSSYKIIFLSPLFYRSVIDKKTFKSSLFENFSFERFKKNIFIVIGVGIGLAAIYLMNYLVIRQFLRGETIVSQLNQLASINKRNILFIGLYIILFNSILEEFFWRGFLFKELRELINPWMAHTLTGIGFSFHHIIFFIGWFELPFLMLATSGLIAFAIVMNFILERYDLFSCWLIHGLVDTVQVFIAFRIFGII